MSCLSGAASTKPDLQALKKKKMKIQLRCIRFYFIVDGKNYDVMHEGEPTGGNARESRNVFKVYHNGEKVDTYHMAGGHANKTNAKKVLEKYLSKTKTL